MKATLHALEYIYIQQAHQISSYMLSYSMGAILGRNMCFNSDFSTSGLVWLCGIMRTISKILL